MQKLDSTAPFPSVLIGKGYWGSVLTRYIKESPYFHLSKIFGSEFQIQLLPKDCKCAFVATPLDSHFKLCEELLLRGVHIFVEKPTCRNLAEFEYLHSLSTRNNAILYTDYPYTLSPSIRHIKTLLLKHLHLAQFPLKFQAKITQYGKFYENEGALEVLGVHWLSVFALFFKETIPFEITAQASSSYPLSVYVKARAKFLESLSLDAQFKEKDFPIDLELTCSLECKEKARTLEISASNFSIYFDMLNAPKITFKIESKETQYFDFDETNTLAFCVQDFACAIKDKKHSTRLLTLHKRVIRFLESYVISLKSPPVSESASQTRKKVHYEI
ncbi:Gfo/Idh/MocA family oxidoreductase [Helicobacter himalayensis]|uniref:Gfo/Idh/MocA family oxidoreductase n=1 Tax=Helicobacter himalayensis TaxID=1591088 RepID=UPI00082B1E34|nr:Gfo/Idh/MocA family oxidoreductase [Helicobacter himalayensis]